MPEKLRYKIFDTILDKAHIGLIGRYVGWEHAPLYYCMHVLIMQRVER